MNIKFYAFLIVVLTISISATSAASRSRKKVAKKIRPIDAKELCLITHGASINDFDLKKCIDKVLKTGKAK